MGKPIKIFLTGMMGSGKSTLGRALAAHLDIGFVDLDEALIALVSQSIPEIFETQGEEAFRRHESHLLNQYCKSDQSFVMATGGGTPCFGSNLEKMNAAGITVFLDVATSILAKRLDYIRTNRPLISHIPSEELVDFLEGMRKSRMAHYVGAKFILEGENLGLNDFKRVGII